MKGVFVRMVNQVDDGVVFAVCGSAEDSGRLVKGDVERLDGRLDDGVDRSDFVETGDLALEVGADAAFNLELTAGDPCLRDAFANLESPGDEVVGRAIFYL